MKPQKLARSSGKEEDREEKRGLELSTALVGIEQEVEVLGTDSSKSSLASGESNGRENTTEVS